MQKKYIVRLSKQERNTLREVDCFGGSLSGMYGDASHPLDNGYALLARRLTADDAFRRFDRVGAAALWPGHEVQAGVPRQHRAGRGFLPRTWPLVYLGARGGSSCRGP